MAMKFWDTVTRFSRVRLGKLKEALGLVSDLYDSLTDEQKMTIMGMATPEQIEKGMKLYQIWDEFWRVETEGKKS